mmetsp:Transcript_55308/g.133381  ORF Transcript_55308/g.133381 Transcript_55308/m.133381 type:complete len:215 (+) Transcript_55308:2216-2860(+)
MARCRRSFTKISVPSAERNICVWMVMSRPLASRMLPSASVMGSGCLMSSMVCTNRRRSFSVSLANTSTNGQNSLSGSECIGKLGSGLVWSTGAMVVSTSSSKMESAPRVRHTMEQPATSPKICMMVRTSTTSPAGPSVWPINHDNSLRSSAEADGGVPSSTQLASVNTSVRAASLEKHVVCRSSQMLPSLTSISPTSFESAGYVTASAASPVQL